MLKAAELSHEIGYALRVMEELTPAYLKSKPSPNETKAFMNQLKAIFTQFEQAIPYVPEVQSLGDCIRCQMMPALPSHSCPFRADISDDEVSECTCCEDCRQECADDI